MVCGAKWHVPRAGGAWFVGVPVSQGRAKDGGSADQETTSFVGLGRSGFGLRSGQDAQALAGLSRSPSSHLDRPQESSVEVGDGAKEALKSSVSNSVR